MWQTLFLNDYKAGADDSDIFPFPEKALLGTDADPRPQDTLVVLSPVKRARGPISLLDQPVQQEKLLRLQLNVGVCMCV